MFTTQQTVRFANHGMKDIELLAQSTARHLVSSAALAIAARCIENRPQTSITKDLSNALRLKAKHEAHAALDIVIAHRSELELFMSMPPINPS